MKKNRIIYLDNSATTQVRTEVYEAIKPYFVSDYFNPDSLYYQAREVKKEIERVRKLIAEEINADADEIFFTGGGSEANTWAIKILSEIGESDGIISTPIEHHSITNAIKQYFALPTLIKLDINESPNSAISNGAVNLDDLEFILKRLSNHTASIMHGNNEIGTIQPISLIGDMLKEYDYYFHTDAVQTFMHVPIDVEDMGVHLLSASGHKIGAPKGVGFLYIKRDIQHFVKPLICGGQQEQGLRGGTTNVPGIIGLGKAIELQKRNKLFTNDRFGDTLEEALFNANGLDFMFTGSITRRLPNHISLCFRDIEGQQLVTLLAEKGILCSTGSACNSGNTEPSYVLQAINIPKQFINGAIRITYSSELTEKDALYVAEAIKDCVQVLRG